jgi:homoserine O-acetyltransferase
MVALAFADRYPERLERLIVISAAHEPHPMITALRSIQRHVVELGLETGRAHDALVLARGLGMTTYRTIREFSERFDPAPESVTASSAAFPVERYLRHQGERFAGRFTAARFLALSLSNDLHAVDPTRITVPTVLIAAEGDSVAPRQQLEQLANDIAGPCELVDLRTKHGHDAFLADAAALVPLLKAALKSSSSELAVAASRANALTP